MNDFTDNIIKDLETRIEIDQINIKEYENNIKEYENNILKCLNNISENNNKIKKLINNKINCFSFSENPYVSKYIDYIIEKYYGYLSDKESWLKYNSFKEAVYKKICKSLYDKISNNIDKNNYNKQIIDSYILNELPADINFANISEENDVLRTNLYIDYQDILYYVCIVNNNYDIKEYVPFIIIKIFINYFDCCI